MFFSNRLLSLILSIFLSIFSSNASDLVEDSFAWQNSQHYQQFTNTLGPVVERELKSCVHQLIGLIDENEEFFSKRHKDLHEYLQETVFAWMNEDVLTGANFENEQNQSPYNDTMSQDEMDEDSWRVDFMEGYDRAVTTIWKSPLMKTGWTMY